MKENEVKDYELSTNIIVSNLSKRKLIEGIVLLIWIIVFVIYCIIKKNIVFTILDAIMAIGFGIYLESECRKVVPLYILSDGNDFIMQTRKKVLYIENKEEIQLSLHKQKVTLKCKEDEYTFRLFEREREAFIEYFESLGVEIHED